MNAMKVEQIAKWIVTSDIGISSQTLFACLFDLQSELEYQYHPGDPSDFGRCMRLLSILDQEQKDYALAQAAKLSPEWNALVERWDYLEFIYGEKRCLFERMQEIIMKAREEKNK